MVHWNKEHETAFKIIQICRIFNPLKDPVASESWNSTGGFQGLLISCQERETNDIRELRVCIDEAGIFLILSGTDEGAHQVLRDFCLLFDNNNQPARNCEPMPPFFIVP
jgi:hypothetical protein